MSSSVTLFVPNEVQCKKPLMCLKTDSISHAINLKIKNIQKEIRCKTTMIQNSDASRRTRIRVGGTYWRSLSSIHIDPPHHGLCLCVLVWFADVYLYLLCIPVACLSSTQVCSYLFDMCGLYNMVVYIRSWISIAFL
jgi:hypothetical protein